MDIKKIALYLSGKIAPDYKKYSRLEFYEHLKEIYGFWLDQLDFYWKQAKEYEEELYFLVLDYLYSKSSKDESEKSQKERDSPNRRVSCTLRDFCMLCVPQACRSRARFYMAGHLGTPPNLG